VVAAGPPRAIVAAVIAAVMAAIIRFIETLLLTA
jgi:hypothetical protein